MAFALQVVVGLGLLRVHRDRRRWVGVVGVITVSGVRGAAARWRGADGRLHLADAAARVLGVAAQSTSGVGVALAGAAVLLFAPLVLIGGAHYPSSGWRTGCAVDGDRGRARDCGAIARRPVALQQSTPSTAGRQLHRSRRPVSPDGTISYASSASRALLGFEPDELVGQTSSALMHPQDAAVLRSRARADATAEHGAGGVSAPPPARALDLV